MHQPGLSADLDSFDLLDLVQVIQMTRRDFALVVRAGSQALGVLRFSQGELLWAELGTLRGEEAFLALAGLHSGSVEEVAWDGHGERNVNQPLSRLVMQAVEYREKHGHHQPQVAPGSDPYSHPVQPGNLAPSHLKSREHFNGASNLLRLGNVTSEPGALPEEEAAPPWVQQMILHSVAETFSAQPTTAMPPFPAASPPLPVPQAPASISAVQTSPLSPSQPEPDYPGSASFFQEGMDVQLPEPKAPLASLNGKFTLPSLSNSSRASPVPSNDLPPDDPPTIPLPSVPGGFRDFAVKRTPPIEVQREPAPEVHRLMDIPPGPAAAAEAAPAAASPSVASPPEPLPTPPLSSPPPAEPKMSSLSILEQLAYGGLGNHNYAEAAPFDAGMPALFGNEPLESTPAAPVAEPPMARRTASHLLENVAGQNGPLPVVNSAPAPSPSAPNDEGEGLQQALEMFAAQVGPACIATAVIRSDGMLLAGYKVRRGQEQDLGSPAYHMAHVMQSSLRALLMGGWGDLEDTIITGSTHSVVLRRLGRAEKEAFHVAVLERSGNPGLCRVRMRNNEAALLQAL